MKGLLVLMAAGAFVIAVFATNALSRPGVDTPVTNPIDFRAFYCGSRVALSGANPYLFEPLHTCEVDALRSVRLRWARNLAVPAPLPPYAFVAFAPVALAPYALAAQMWFVLSLLAIGFCVVSVSSLTGLRPFVVGLALLPSEIFASVALGQLVPFIMSAVCATALLLRAGRTNWAAVVSLTTMLEPHVGLPLCAALCVWVPASRRIVVAGGALLALASVAIVGPATTWQYFAAVLPAHAHSELTNLPGQYSLSPLLVALGVGDSMALSLGGVSYALSVAGGVWLGGVLAKRLSDAALLALVPAALVLVGGTFLHLHQVVLALPLALVMLARMPRGASRVAFGALVVSLAVPWETLAEWPQVFDHISRHAHVAPTLLAPTDPASLAESSWEAWVRAAALRDTRTTQAIWLIKAPTLAGLLLLAAYVVGLACRLRPVRPVSDIGAERIHDRGDRGDRGGHARDVHAGDEAGVDASRERVARQPVL